MKQRRPRVRRPVTRADSPAELDSAPALSRSFVVRRTAFSEFLGPVWRAGTICGGAFLLIGALMVIVARGVTAVICWPLGTLLLIMGAVVLHGTICARRAVDQFEALGGRQEAVVVEASRMTVSELRTSSPTKPE